MPKEKGYRMKKGDTKKNVNAYKALFIFGLAVFIPIGIGLESSGRSGLGFIVMGLIFIFAGVGHRKEW